MKTFKIVLLITILLIILIYVTNITAIPNSIILFKGEDLNLGTILGLYVYKNYNNEKTVTTGVAINNEKIVEKNRVSLKLFNLIKVKDIDVSVIPKTTVIPLGNSVGLKLYTSGVLVVGMTEIEGEKPYQDSGIEEGDMIIKVNEEDITCTSELVNSVNSSKRRWIKYKIYKRWERVCNYNETNKNRKR